MTTQGILYVAAGKEHIRAAIHSAATVQAHCPGLSTHLYADWPSHGFRFDASTAPFTSVGVIESPHRRSKVDYLPLSPFDQTLYLDNDSAVNADIREMFRVLERYDLALTHVPLDRDEPRLTSWKVELPPAYPYFNSGVLLYRKTPFVANFLEQWRDWYKESGLRRDEVTLRELIWLSDLRVAVLPGEYNVRYSKNRLFSSAPDSNVKIYHLKQLHENQAARLRSAAIRKIRKFLGATAPR